MPPFITRWGQPCTVMGFRSLLDTWMQTPGQLPYYNWLESSRLLALYLIYN